MRLTKLQLAAALAITGLGLSLPAGAAASKFEETSAHFTTTNGFKVFVDGGAGSDRLTFVVNKGPVGTSYTLLSGATSTPTRMQGDFGQFGSVDLTFHPRKTKHIHNPHDCRGNETRKIGTWKGSVTFHGENGYTNASKTKLKGDELKGSIDCPDEHGKFIDLFAASPPGPSSKSIRVDAPKGGDKRFFFATAYDTVGNVDISRTAIRDGKPKEFKFNKALTHATVDPAGPFKGSATFDHGDWTGNLAAKFPGVGAVPLTGSGFTATLSEQHFKRGKHRSN